VADGRLQMAGSSVRCSVFSDQVAGCREQCSVFSLLIKLQGAVFSGQVADGRCKQVSVSRYSS